MFEQEETVKNIWKGYNKVMSTKERIVEEALTLFSSRGYQGTSVKNIADAVGIKDSSLYKHFKAKRRFLRPLWRRWPEEWRP